MVDPASCRLGHIRIFSGLSVDDIEKVETQCVFREFAADETIITPGETAQVDVYFVVRGGVRVALPAGAGGEIAFVDLGEGDHFGEMAALDEHTRSASVIVREDSLIASLGEDDFRALLLAHPQVSYELLRHFAGIIRRGNERIIDLSTRTDVQRVYSEILRLSEPNPNGDGSWIIPRMPKHREIAAWAGTDEESVATAIGQLLKVGLAKRRYPAFHILDRNKVRRLAELA